MTAFYVDVVGFHPDVVPSAGSDFRIVQLTPPGSACSVTLMRNAEAAGSVHGVHLVVDHIVSARADLVSRGTEVSDYLHHGLHSRPVLHFPDLI